MHDIDATRVTLVSAVRSPTAGMIDPAACEPYAGRDVLSLQIRHRVQDRLLRETCAKQVQHVRYADPHPSDAWPPTALLCVGGDAVGDVDATHVYALAAGTRLGDTSKEDEVRADEFPPEQMPSARYPCGNPACAWQSGWPAEELGWRPGGDDGRGTAWPPGFYCRSCQGEAPARGAAEDAPTLAKEMARRAGLVGERVDDANLIKMQAVGTLVCNAQDLEELALLEVPLVDEDGKQKDWPWHIPVDYDWPKSGYLPHDLVSVEATLAANGEGEPLLIASRVRLLRQDITGEQRVRLLECEDTMERWDRAFRLSRA